MQLLAAVRAIDVICRHRRYGITLAVFVGPRAKARLSVVKRGELSIRLQPESNG